MRFTRFEILGMSFLAIAGCGKQDYSAPAAFMEHYGQELLAKSFGREKMDFIGLDKFAFYDVNVGIEQYQGEYVSAIFDAIPKRNERIHHIVKPRLLAVDCSLPRAASGKYYSAETEERLRRIGDSLNAGYYAPILYHQDALTPGFDASRHSDALRVRIYRAKGSDGILRPITGTDAISLYMGEGGKTKCDFSLDAFFRRWSGEIANEKHLKECNAVPLESNAVHKAITEYNSHVANITNSFKLLRSVINANHSDGGSFDVFFAAGDESPKLKELEAMRPVVGEAKRLAGEAARNLQAIRSISPNAEKSAKVVRDIEASLRELKPKLDKASIHRDNAREKVGNLSAIVAENRRSVRRDRNNLERAQSELVSCENSLLEIGGQIADLERRLRDARGKAAADKAAYDRFFESKEYVEARETDRRLAQDLREKLARENALQQEARYECEKIVINKTIEQIFSEVAALNAAIGNSPDKSLK